MTFRIFLIFKISPRRERLCYPSINFQGNYNIDPSKASPLCKVVAAVDISKFAKEFDGEMTFNPEAHDAFDAVQQPYTLAIDEDKISIKRKV